MSDQNQPLDNQPQGDDDFDAAFDEFSGGGGADTSATDADFEGGNQDQGDGDGQPAEGDGQDDQQGEGQAGPSDEGMTPRERELHEQLERLRHSEASQRGRLGAYQRQINELQRQMQERQGGGQQSTASAQPSQQPSHGGQDAASDDQQRQDMAESMGLESWEEFKADFPDMARAVDARLEQDRQKSAQLERELAELRSTVQPIQQQAQEQHRMAQEDALAARHPDWQKVVAAPEFAEWLNQQPDSLQRLTDSEDAAEAAALLDMYRAQTGNAGPADSHNGTPDKRQQRLAAAQAPQRRGRARPSQAPDDFDAAFDYYASKQGAR